MNALRCTKGHPVAPNETFCGDCGSPVTPAASAVLETPENIATYRDALAAFWSDGVLEDWEREELEAMRADLGIRSETRERLLAQVRPAVAPAPVSLHVDKSAIEQFTTGARCVVRFRVLNEGQRALKHATLLTATSATRAVQQAQSRVLGPGRDDVVTLAFVPEVSGHHELSGCLVVSDMKGVNSHFVLRTTTFMVAQTSSGNTTSVVSIDAGNMRVGDFSGLAAAAGPSSKGGGLVEGGEWRKIELTATTVDAFERWKSGADDSAPVVRARADLAGPAAPPVVPSPAISTSEVHQADAAPAVGPARGTQRWDAEDEGEQGREQQEFDEVKLTPEKGASPRVAAAPRGPHDAQPAGSAGGPSGARNNEVTVASTSGPHPRRGEPAALALEAKFSNGATVVVASDGSGDATTIQEGIARAPAWSTITVRPGRYRGPIVIDRPLAIRGVEQVDILPPAYNDALAPYAAARDACGEWLAGAESLLKDNDVYGVHFWWFQERRAQLAKAANETFRLGKQKIREHLLASEPLLAQLTHANEVFQRTLAYPVFALRADAALEDLRITVPGFDGSWRDFFDVSYRARPNYCCVRLEGDVACSMRNVHLSGGDICMEVRGQRLAARVFVEECTLADAEVAVDVGTVGTLVVRNSTFRRISRWLVEAPKSRLALSDNQLDGC